MDALRGLPKGDMHRLAELCETWTPRLTAHAGELARDGSHRMDAGAKYNQFVALLLSTGLLRLLKALKTCEEGSVAAGRPELAERYRKVLERQSGEAFSDLVRRDEARALDYASGLDPACRDAFGIALQPAQQHAVEMRIASSSARPLGAAEILSLRNYVHPRTGTFNLYRAVHLMKRHVPDEPFSDHAVDLLRPFDHAVEALAGLPSARVRSPAFYKGLALDTAFVTEWLERLYLHDEAMPIDWPTSVATKRWCSYAGTPGYAHELVFRGEAEAIDVSAFHPAETLYNQAEALLLAGQAFTLRERSLEAGPDHGFTRYSADLQAPAGLPRY
ncbi:MAG: hypothetical protein EOO24_06440 [Comamonadaceae bacterium]|nr:MAG: hypothetical protein EOO24_06440 [Comamonadaceae bacterium]